MKFLLFRILLLHRTRDQGFTLPMVIGIGLIMVLLGSVSLVQSSEENLNAISKDSSSTSLAMAELGVARYRELLNNNRVLAIYSLSNWTTVADQTCDEISAGTGGWANSNDWREITLNENDYDVDFDDDGNKTNTEALIGSYRIVDYRFQNDSNTNDDSDVDNNGDYTDVGEDNIFDQTSDANNTNNPRGILTVQGRKRDDGGVAQIQVTIPIGVNPNDLESLDPGIWIHQSNETAIDFGILNFSSGNLVLDRDSAGDDQCANVTTPITDVNKLPIRDPRNLPPLATLPLPSMRNNLSSGGSNNDIRDDFRYGAIVPDQLILGTVNTPNPDPTLAPLPEIQNSDGRYYYEVGTSSSPENLTINGGQKIITDGNSKVIIYVNGHLNIIGNVDITNSSDDATSRFLEIHVTGDVNISGGGTVNIKGLIHAPNGTVNITGSTVNLTGSIWAADWDSIAGTVTVNTDDYKFYSITPNRTPKPLTYPPTGWQQREAKDY